MTHHSNADYMKAKKQDLMPEFKKKKNHVINLKDLIERFPKDVSLKIALIEAESKEIMYSKIIGFINSELLKEEAKS